MTQSPIAIGHHGCHHAVGEKVLAGDIQLRSSLHQRCAEIGLPPFETIRVAFPEGRDLYLGAGFQEGTHVQICVRHTRQSVGYFRVRT